MRYFLLSLCISFTSQAEIQDKSIQQKSIQVSDHELNFIYIKGTEPAIVFESGSGFVEADYWKDMMMSISEKTNNAIIAYDRAGYGESQLPLTDYNIENEVADLKTALTVLGYQGSIVYVGWSYGHYFAKVFASNYPDSVHSLLFLDPVTTHFIDGIGGISSYMEDLDLSALPDTRFGDALRRETAGMPMTYETVKKINFNGAFKCYVIAAENPFAAPPEELVAWREGQELLANECLSEIIVPNDSIHDIANSAPDSVINTLLHLLE